MNDFVCLACKRPFQHVKSDKKYCSRECWANRHPHVDVVCKRCGTAKSVPWRWRESKYCSTKCASEASSDRQRQERVVLTCAWAGCGKKFKVLPRMATVTRHCSRACLDATVRGGKSAVVTLTCEGCGNAFERPFIHRDQRFCSKSCAHSGERNGMYGKPGPLAGKPAWNAGLTVDTDERVARNAERVSIALADKIVQGEWDHQPGFMGSHFESKKCSATFYCRSSYERRYLERLETDDAVVSYAVEPFRIPYMFEGRVHNYVPDVLVERTVNSVICRELVEVKPASLVDSPMNAAKAAAARAWCEQQGIAYVVVTEADLDAHHAR